MENAIKLKQLETLKGQLSKIEDVLENYLSNDEYLDMCESTGQVGSYIKLVSKKLKEVE